MRTPCDFLKLALTAVMMAVLGAMLSGCALRDFISLEPAAVTSDRAAFESAQAAFLAGNLSSARKTFGRLSAAASLPEIRRSARYGLACADMVQAEDTEGFQTAVESFLQVISDSVNDLGTGLGGDSEASKRSQKSFPKADPVLLARGLSRGMALTCQARKADRKKLSAGQAKEKKWKKERAKMQHLIDTLQHQITVLERIDQERQEKRRVQ
tara:strand:- start:921 stop:1556 length:636 start_codon:yes stop_codon:yes gene_type:complete